MKHDWQDVPMPKDIAALPTDARGFPITFVSLIQSDGRPDFTTIDGEKIMRCLTEGLCGLCGNGWPALETRNDDHLIAFIGGPISCGTGSFLDPAMHVTCAEYAMKVCPHIAINTSRYSKPKEGEGRELFQGVSPDRPAKFGLYITDAFNLINYMGQPMFKANEPIDIIWSE